jgi:alkylation response protein AidB-like acyl-CoA dehydrogenase
VVLTEEELRSEIRAWLAGAWDPSLTVGEWWRRLADSGYGFPHWPAEWFGRSMSPVQAAVVREELARARVLGPPTAVGTSMGAPVLLAHGTDEQRSRWLPPLARGEELWCQFFSEPGAGSDLASVQTRAVRQGEDWVVNGQKVWNSATLLADRGILLARTDPDVPKHRGLSFFVIDVEQPGVTIRPIRQMNGRSEFNETFFTDARVAGDAMIGGPGDGWRAAMTTLGNERTEFAGGWEHPLVIVAPGKKAGHLERIVGDLLEDRDRDDIGEANTPPLHTSFQVVDLARRYGRANDSTIRDRIARVHAMSEALDWTAQRAAAAAAAGRQPGAESSIGYVGGVRLLRRIRDLVAEIAGPAGLLTGSEGAGNGDVAMTVLTVPCHGIQGGSEQIQLNILGERLLGLPKEPQVDRDVPFRERGTPRRRGSP